LFCYDTAFFDVYEPRAPHRTVSFKRAVLCVRKKPNERTNKKVKHPRGLISYHVLAIKQWCSERVVLGIGVRAKKKESKGKTPLFYYNAVIWVERVFFLVSFEFT